MVKYRSCAHFLFDWPYFGMLHKFHLGKQILAHRWEGGGCTKQYQWGWLELTRNASVWQAQYPYRALLLPYHATMGQDA